LIRAADSADLNESGKQGKGNSEQKAFVASRFFPSVPSTDFTDFRRYRNALGRQKIRKNETLRFFSSIPAFLIHSAFPGLLLPDFSFVVRVIRVIRG